MTGCAPSSSGRPLEGAVSSKASGRPYADQFSLARTGCAQSRRRYRAVKCQAVALPGRLQLLKALHWALRTPQVGAEPFYYRIEAEPEAQESSRGATLQQLLRQATSAAIKVGLKLTGVAMLLAKRMFLDLRHPLRLLKAQQQFQSEAVAAKKLLDAQSLLKFEAMREKMLVHGKDAAFVKMLHVLDRSHMDHDAKWALVQKHTADKAEFCERLQHLFKAAGDSKEAIETALRPDASRSEINRFWRSEQTAALIAEEESLKQLVFAQMLQVA